MRSIVRSRGIIGAAIAGILVSAVALGGASAASAAPDPVVRWSGASRYETSVAIAQAQWKSTNPLNYVYIANGTTFPDALAGAPVAGIDNGPILLVQQNSIPAAVTSYLQSHNANNIVVLGGTGAVSDAVESQLQTYAAGPVSRQSGASRYDTAVAIAKSQWTNCAGGIPNVYIASGANFPDALSGAPVAGMNDGPILLVQPNAVPASVTAFLKACPPWNLYVLGGTGAVSDKVANALAGLSVSGVFNRWSGASRYETSASIAQSAFPSGAATVYVASGATFPDALSGAPVGAITHSPILLVQQNSIPAAVATYLKKVKATTTKIVILGGTGAVSNAVKTQLESYVG